MLSFSINLFDYLLFRSETPFRCLVVISILIMTFFGWLFVFEYFADLTCEDLLWQAKLVHHFIEDLLQLVARVTFLCEGHKHLVTFGTIYEFLSKDLLNRRICLFALDRISNIRLFIKRVHCVDVGPR